MRVPRKTFYLNVMLAQHTANKISLNFLSTISDGKLNHGEVSNICTILAKLMQRNAYSTFINLPSSNFQKSQFEY